MSAVTIEFADSRYRFAGLSPEQAGLLQSRFELLMSSGDADVEIDVHYSPNAAGFMRRPAGPVEYPLALSHGADQIAVAGIGFTANIDRKPFRAQMQTCLDDAWFLAGAENLFRVVACYRLFSEGALVMHSAGFVDGARGFVLCGRSGAGKTTLCRLADEIGLSVLSDELNAITPSHGSFVLQPMPFAGDFGGAPRPRPPYPLTAWLGLSQGAAPALRRCSKAEAVSRIVASCPYTNADPVLIDPLTARVADLVDRFPFHVLSFAKDRSFWSVLNHEYPRTHAALPR